MKKLVLISIFGAMSLAAMGQESSNVEEIIVTAPAIQLPSQPYRLNRDELDNVLGWYELSNGETMSLFSVRGDLYAQVKGQPRHEIVAASPDTFVAKDRQMKIVLDRDEAVGESVVKAGKLFTVVRPQARERVS